MKVRVLFILCLLSTNTLWAETSSDCLNLHVIENAPIGYREINGLPTGVHWEYLAAIEKVSDICIDQTLLPYLRIWQSIEQGEHDGGIIFKSESNSQFVEYVAHIRTVKVVVIAINGIEINHYEDLKNLRIGKTRGTLLSKRFDQDASLNIIELNNYGQAAKMINYGRIDAIAGSALVLGYQLNKYNVLDKVDLTRKLVLGEKEQWLQLSKSSKFIDKITDLQTAVKELKGNGTFDTIMEKYYGKIWGVINQ